MSMLDSTSATILKIMPHPAPGITGKHLARNRLPSAARLALALRLLRGGEPVSEFTVAQAARLCRVSRAKIDQHLGRHRQVGEALARAFNRASPEQRIAFVREAGCEKVWEAMQAAL
jgi:hypothetical protein